MDKTARRIGNGNVPTTIAGLFRLFIPRSRIVPILGAMLMGTTFYPKFEDFADIFRFVQDFQVRADRMAPFHLTATHPVTGSTFEAYIGGEKLFEIENNISRKHRNILDKPVRIDSVEMFAWVLFCKLKQKHELMLK